MWRKLAATSIIGAVDAASGGPCRELLPACMQLPTEHTFYEDDFVVH